MTWVTGTAVFICLWWVVIFAVLPWGVRQDEAPVAGSERGAPSRPMLRRKIVATTLITAVLWVAYYLLLTNGYLNLSD